MTTPKTEVQESVKLIDQKHEEGSAIALAIVSVSEFKKDYDGYLMNMLSNKVPARQAELLYKKIGSEMGFILTVAQKKLIAKEVFESNDLTTTEGIDNALTILLEKIDLSKGGIKSWMKAYAEAKKITLGKASVASAGPSKRTGEIIAFIESGHEANQPKEKIIKATMAKYDIKESTAKSRYNKASKKHGWDVSPEDTKLRKWALENAQTISKDDILKRSKGVTKAVVTRLIHSVAFFQEVMDMAPTDAEKAEVQEA